MQSIGWGFCFRVAHIRDIVTSDTQFIIQDLDRINSYLMKAFLVLPHYCLGRGLIDMTRNQLIADAFAVFGKHILHNPSRYIAQVML